MAANLSYKNGNAEMLYVGETPWHQEGFKFERAPTWAELLAVVDYDVDKMPYYYPAVRGTGMVEATDAFYLMRRDTGIKLGTVGGDYTPIPNREAFAALQPLVDAGVATIETAGVLRAGADAWLLCRWNLDKFGPAARDALGGEVVPFSTVIAGHTGKRAVLLGNTPIRIVCSNTLGMAVNDAERGGAAGSRWRAVKHTKSGAADLVRAAEDLFAGVISRYEVIGTQYRALREKYITAGQFAALVLDVVAPDPRKSPDFNPEAKTAEMVVDRALTKRALLSSLWTAGKGHTGEPTAWFAYNAAVEALDHNKHLWPVKAGAWRTASMLDGNLADLKNRVLDGLVLVSLAG